jgi:hypothetical protein
MPQQQCIKGSSYKAVLTYLEKTFGADAPRKVIEELLPEDQAIFKSNIFSSTWLPEKTYGNLLSTADRIFGKGDYELCISLGHDNAHNNIPKLYSMFIRYSNPQFVLGSASMLWGQLHNSGKFTIIERETKSATFTLTDYYHPPRIQQPSLLLLDEGIHKRRSGIERSV